MARKYKAVSDDKLTIPGQFAWRTIAMLESPAYRAMSLTAHRALSRIEIEFGHHGGKSKENGRLIVTYDQFVTCGIDRAAIWPALNELVKLGFIEITESGCAGNESFRRPNRFRLTYRHSGVTGDITDDWRNIETIADAKRIATEARSEPGKIRSPVGVSRANSRKTPTEPAEVIVGNPPLLPMVGKPILLSISRGGYDRFRGAAGEGGLMRRKWVCAAR